MRRRDRTAGRRRATAPVLAAVLPLLAAVAAAAHGTRAEVAVQQTGDRDRLVRQRLAEGGHAIVEPAKLDVSATNSATGQAVRPVTAAASAQPGDDAVTLPAGDAAPEADRGPLLFGALSGGLTLLAGIAVVTRLNRRARRRLAARPRGRARPTPARGGRSALSRNRRGARAGAGARPKRRRG